MNDDTRREAGRLVGMLGDRGLMAEARAARAADPVDQLRLAVFDFFTRAIDRVDRLERSRDKAREVVDRLTDRVMRDIDDPGVDLETLLARAEKLFRMMSSEANRANDSIIGLFRPVPGAPSILANSVGSHAQSEDDPDAFYDRLTSDQRAVFERLREMLNASRFSDGKSIDGDGRG